MTTNDGGPAFPVGSGDMRDPTGLSIRDWFAGMAMQGELSAQSEDSGSWNGIYPQLAERCYQVADAMLAARGKS